MRKEYRQAIHGQFLQEFGRQFPAFSKRKSASTYYSSAELLLGRRSALGTEFLIIVSPHGNGHEAFTVEVGWSKKGDLPRLSMRPSAAPPRSGGALQSDEFVTRLAYIDERIPEFWYLERAIADLSGDDVMRQILESTKPLLAEIAAERVRDAVQQAVGATVAVGIPYLREAGYSDD
jgi:hypothetical protein